MLPNEGVVVHKAEAAVDTAIQHKKVDLGRSYDGFYLHLTQSGGKFKWLGRGGYNQMAFFYNTVVNGFSEKNAQFNIDPPSRFKLISVVRHPADRLRSHFDYYLKGTRKFQGSFTQFLAAKAHHYANFQSIEHGLYTLVREKCVCVCVCVLR